MCKWMRRVYLETFTYVKYIAYLAAMARPETLLLLLGELLTQASGQRSAKDSTFTRNPIHT